jgi:hypothetical protein
MRYQGAALAALFYRKQNTGWVGARLGSYSIALLATVDVHPGRKRDPRKPCIAP